MKLSEALKYYEQGKKIRRKGWMDSDCIYPKPHQNSYHMDSYDMLQTDWEIVDEPKPKKKVKVAAFIHKDVLSGWASILYIHEHETVNTENMIRLPALDQEIEVEDE